jgi:hypothetical protein
MKGEWAQVNLDDPSAKPDPHTRSGMALECYTLALCCFALAGERSIRGYSWCSWIR